MILRILALALLFTGLNTAYAQDDVLPEIELVETCELTSQNLTKGLQIYCDGELTVKPGTVINTDGHFFQISTNGALNLNGTLTIDANGRPGTILIYVGLHMSGQLKIKNADSEGYGEYVEITAGALAADYQQEIDNGVFEAGLADKPVMYVAGEALNLVTDLNRIARN